MNTLASTHPSGLRMTVSASPRMNAAELRGFLFRPEMLQRWVGPEAVVPARVGGLAMLPTPDGSYRNSMVTRITDSDDTVSSSLTAESGPGPRLTITVTGVAAGLAKSRRDTSTVRITVGNLKDHHQVRLSLAFWQAALNRLTSIVHAIRRRRDSPKQALIIIHGIGEQQPGQTLTEFVRGVFGEGVGPGRWVKPDTLLGSFETRKVTLQAVRPNPNTEGRPTTDVYELYWAHLIVDSTVGQVLAWAKSLLLRRDIPPSLRPHVWTIRIIAALMLLILLGFPIYKAFTPKSTADLVVVGSWATLLAVALAVGGVLWKVFKGPGTKLLTGFLGDAARYFEPKPENIARRQEIREEGVRLLEKLHESGEYQRIVIAAHSLGSAIAYDILTFTWNRMHGQHERPDRQSLTALEAAEKASDATRSLRYDARTVQTAAWMEHRRNTQPWLVTDLVTMGSPLTHAHILMAASADQFNAMIRDKVFPTCPPQPDDRKGPPRFSYALPNRSTDGSRGNTFVVPDHGALFAITRWTNLYFPAHGIIGGDPVGGPLNPLFGTWIYDRPVKAREVGLGGFAHTKYWATERSAGPYKGKPGEDHLECLRDALDLNTAGRLRTLAAARPTYTYLRRK